MPYPHDFMVGLFGNILRKLRFNNRDNDHIFRDTLRRIMTTDALTYETLTA